MPQVAILWPLVAIWRFQETNLRSQVVILRPQMGIISSFVAIPRSLVVISSPPVTNPSPQVAIPSPQVAIPKKIIFLGAPSGYPRPQVTNLRFMVGILKFQMGI